MTLRTMYPGMLVAGALLACTDGPSTADPPALPASSSSWMPPSTTTSSGGTSGTSSECMPGVWDGIALGSSSRREPVGEWQCASGSLANTPGWDMVAHVPESADMCPMFVEGWTLRQTAATQAQARFLPGDFPLPSQDGEYTLHLPICVRFLSGTPTGLQFQSAVLRVEHTTFSRGEAGILFHLTQPMVDSNQETWNLNMMVRHWLPCNGEAQPVLLDGIRRFDGWLQYWSLAKSNAPETRASLDSCTMPHGELERHIVEFAGGRAALDLRLVKFIVHATEAAMFVAARGTLDQEDFVQEDQIRLVYSAPHHHIERSYLVLFDRPRENGVCGLMFEYLPAMFNNDRARVSTVSCDLAELDERAFTSATIQQVP